MRPRQNGSVYNWTEIQKKDHLISVDLILHACDLIKRHRSDKQTYWTMFNSSRLAWNFRDIKEHGVDIKAFKSWK